ncbi:hypothetical protein GBAR_LOCUS10058, partial [Geodia barretti]
QGLEPTPNIQEQLAQQRDSLTQELDQAWEHIKGQQINTITRK